MAVGLYFDHNVFKPILKGVRAQGVDVLTAYEDGLHEAPDAIVLDRAEQLRRAIFSMDVDFLIEASLRSQEGASFAGVLFARQTNAVYRAIIDDLVLVASLTTYEELEGRVTFLPL